jgi:hypothetical protein
MGNEDSEDQIGSWRDQKVGLAGNKSRVPRGFLRW